MKGGEFVLKRKIERWVRGVSKKQTSANKGGGGLMGEKGGGSKNHSIYVNVMIEWS